MNLSISYVFTIFFFNDTATTEIYTLSLHDALPIWWFALVVAVVVVGEGVLIGAYRSTMGVWTATWDGFPSSTVWVAFGVALALFAASAAVHLWAAVVWPIWVLAAVTVVGFVALGRWTDVVWRRRQT